MQLSTKIQFIGAVAHKFVLMHLKLLVVGSNPVRIILGHFFLGGGQIE